MHGKTQATLLGTAPLLSTAAITVRADVELLFRWGSSHLSIASQLSILPIVSLVAMHETSRIRIVGHTDSEGPAAWNLELSRARAETVAAYLVSRGIAGNRIETVGLGEGSPRSSNSTAAGRAINRRADMTILNQLPVC